MRKVLSTKTGDLKKHTISYYSLPFNGRLVRQHFTGSVYLPKPSLGEAVRSLCVGEAEAVFADHLSIFSLLLSDPPCAGASLRMLPNPACKIELGIGARREARAAADAIREEISVMAGDGSLGKIADVWSYAPGQELASLIVLQEAKNHLRLYRIGFVAVGCLLAFALWVAAAYRQKKNTAQAYYRALSQAESHCEACRRWFERNGGGL